MFLAHYNNQLCYKCNIERTFLSSGMKPIFMHKATRIKLEPAGSIFSFDDHILLHGPEESTV